MGSHVQAPVLDRLYARIREAAIMGDNAVIRRIEAIVSEELGARARVAPSDEDADPDSSDFRVAAGDRSSSMTLSELIQEFQADDRRRSVFLDAEESVTAALTDYYSGRLSSVEFRNPGWAFDFEELRRRALERMREELPLVAVNHAIARDVGEIVYVLRSLADALEDGTHWAEMASERIADACTMESRELGTRWRNNGRVLERGHQAIVKCCKKDPRCSNDFCFTETQEPVWKREWWESGSKFPPPIKPPSYGAIPWNNRAPIFEDSKIGTITSDYGWRTVNGRLDFHPAVDIAAPIGSVVQSLHSGTITIINNGGPDQGIHIRDNDHNLFVYYHIGPESDLEDGQTVVVGQKLGKVLAWPNKPGREHLHHAHYTPAEQRDEYARDPVPPEPERLKE